MPISLENGSILLQNGSVLLDECCCGEITSQPPPPTEVCNHCDIIGNTLAVWFDYVDPLVPLWSTWIPQQQQTFEQCVALDALWFPIYPTNYLADAYGCVFAAYAPLPCGIENIITVILDGGRDGIVDLLINVIWDKTYNSGTFSGQTIVGASGNCIDNLTFNSLNAFSFNSGFGIPPDSPCYAQIIYDFSLTYPYYPLLNWHMYDA